MKQQFWILGIIILFSNKVFAQSGNLKNSIYQDSASLVEIYKDIHQNPELAFMEYRTSKIVEEELMKSGYKVYANIGKTGVVGIMENGKGPTIMYRADMDCNAVKEETNLAYASIKTMKKEDGTEVPVMHACGHDAHVAWLIGIARAMSQHKKLWKGTLVFVAQPAEEIIQGAKAMIQDTLFQKVVPIPDFLFGMHTWPIPVGTIYNGSGVRFAGTDQLDVTFFGVGGHGASPEQTKDPIVMASNAVLQYQTIISRNIAAQEAAVLTVGSFISGNSNNIIPANATLKLNLRWFNDKTRRLLLTKINDINEGIARANNLPQDLYPKVTFKSNVYPLINDQKLQNRVNKSLSKILNPANIISNTPPVMVSEDFQNLASTSSQTIYDYIFVGVANKNLVETAKNAGKDYPYYNHNGNYLVDLSAIPLGAFIGFTALLGLFN